MILSGERGGSRRSCRSRSSATFSKEGFDQVLRPRFCLPLINLAFFLLVAVQFVGAHGGKTGDYDVSRFNGDTISEPGDTGLVFFNRWQFSAKESLITKVFLILNIVSILGAKFILQAVAQINEQFQTPFPFGLSYASYSLMVGLAFSMLQWYGAGLAFEIVKTRYFTRKDPLGKA